MEGGGGGEGGTLHNECSLMNAAAPFFVPGKVPRCTLTDRFHGYSTEFSKNYIFRDNEKKKPDIPYFTLFIYHLFRAF